VPILTFIVKMIGHLPIVRRFRKNVPFSERQR